MFVFVYMLKKILPLLRSFLSQALFLKQSVDYQAITISLKKINHKKISICGKCAEKQGMFFHKSRQLVQIETMLLPLLTS